MNSPSAPDPAGYTLGRRFKRVLRPTLAVARRTALRALRTTRPRGSPARASTVHLFVFNAYNAGGINRAVLSVLPHLAEHRDVELISVTRDRDEPFYSLPSNVRLTVLDDRRRRTVLGRLPSLLWHDADGAYRSASLRTDVALVRKLRSIRAGVVMGTRPGLNNILAELAAPNVVTVGQVHSDLGSQHPALVVAMRRHHRRLDGLSVLTADHERDYRAFLAGAPTSIACIPNAVPASTAGRSTQDADVVVAAARMFPEKGYDVLLAAFALVVRQQPNWRLRIFGEGPLQEAIAAQIAATGLTDHVLLCGLTDRLDEEMQRASIFVLSSRSEGFGMVLVEAMSRGLAVVSTDCDHGPRDIITSGVDGLLVPVDDVPALADALVTLMADRDRRQQLAARAVEAVDRYSQSRITALWLDFLDGLTPVEGPDHSAPLLSGYLDTRTGDVGRRLADR